MNLKEIKELVQLMEKMGISRLAMKEGDREIELEREVASTKIDNPMIQELVTHRQTASPKKMNLVTSPMVGTCYLSSGPDAPFFKKIGDSVKVGDILCIVEAMKVMNEIKAVTAGMLKRVCVENASPVEFGTPLFEIE